jgi:hypothetical protein
MATTPWKPGDPLPPPPEEPFPPVLDPDPWTGPTIKPDPDPYKDPPIETYEPVDPGPHIEPEPPGIEIDPTEPDEGD